MKNEYDYLNDVTVDFSKYEEIKLSEKELKKMKKITSKKKICISKIAAVAASIAIVAALSQTALAKQLMDRIIKTVSTGQNSFTQYDSSDMTVEIPDEYKGLFFDRKGNELEYLTMGKAVYDADGSEITDMVAYLNEHLNSDEYIFASGNRENYSSTIEYCADNGYSILQGEELSKLSDVLDFAPLLPGEFPEGFDLTAAAYFDTDGKYVTLACTNAEGQEIIIMERILNEDTATHMGTDSTIEEIEINGNKAVLIGDQSLDWEVGNLSVAISGRGNITRDELIAMAESMR